jgi:crossover junction endodeoxyribonuclease RuvC
MFLGLDLSLTESGLVIIDKDYKIITATTLSVPQKGIERLSHLETLFLEALGELPIDLCCIESPAFKAEGHLFNIGELNGILKLNLYKKGIQFIMAAPTQLKKYVTGTGKGNKSAIILDVYKNFKEEIRNDNIADAYVLSRIARDFYIKPTNLYKYQTDVLKKLLKANEDEQKGHLL